MLLLEAFHEGGQDVWRLHLCVESDRLYEVRHTEDFLDVGVVGEDFDAEVMIEAEQKVSFVDLGLINGKVEVHLRVKRNHLPQLVTRFFLPQQNIQQFLPSFL